MYHPGSAGSGRTIIFCPVCSPTTVQVESAMPSRRHRLCVAVACILQDCVTSNAAAIILSLHARQHPRMHRHPLRQHSRGTRARR
eukprot:2658381-Rhodomonas_salina.1